MRPGSLRFPLLLSGFGLLGACSNIIGISDYRIDPKLDADPGSAGKSDGGDTASAGDGSGGDGSGGDGGGGDTSSAGAPTQSGCQTAEDCDDTIDCTTDKCASNGECVHTPSDATCDATQCEKCELGVGCVAGAKTQTQLLLDPGFDLQSGDWDESESDDVNMVASNAAQSGTHVAQFGPAAADAAEQQYSDLLQWVTIPEGTVALTLSGYYRLTPGTKAPKDDYVVAAFYESGQLKPATQFHSFEATIGVQNTWKAFSYPAPKADVATMAGKEYTFDIVGHVWDSTYYMDSLQLNATVCQ